MFIAREKELKLLDGILEKPTGSVMIYGKRKVGKTTLITHALKKSSDKTIYYECMKSTMEDNVENFVTVLVREKVLPVVLAFKSFADIFAYLNTMDKTFNIVIDEYPYLKMCTRPETVDSIFQTIIDNYIGNIRIYISGSHVGMMRDMLEEQNALYGRFSLTIQLKEMNYKEVSAFYRDKDVYDKIAFYSVFGGSPYVNGFIDSDKTLRENITQTILNDSHPIYHYAEQLLISDFTNAIGAERIFYAISNGKKKYSEIEDKLGMKNNGLLSKQLASLIRMEIISKTYPINRPHDSKKTAYEMNDNLLRFYYAFVYKNKSALQVLGAGAFYDEYVQPSLTTFISHRFEEICRCYFSLQAKAGKLKG
ncbi:MAG: AAA family ATPase, partial [Butyrivibrio sp.]|nr:AAA family ATPase [Butyrivibrio sp.]